MTTKQVSRRGFLKAATSAAGAAWLSAHWPSVMAAAEEAAAARDAGAGFDMLTAEQAADFAAIAAQIFPTDELPGANEAGVVYFIDTALRTFMSGAAESVSKGLRALNKKAGAAQAELLKQEEATPFFGTVHFMTVAGMFALPSYGGNRKNAGWKLLGFDHRHAWAPPFGHYDTPAKPGAKS